MGLSSWLGRRSQIDALRSWYRLQTLLVKLVIYFVLLSLGFVFVHPVLYMLVTSVMGEQDLVSPFVQWIPRQFNLYNYYLATIALRFGASLRSTTLIAVLGAVGQCLSCAVAGYSLARYRFPGRNLIFLLVVLTFIVPPQTLMIPLFIQFHRFNWIDTYLPFVVPAFLGHGLRGALYVIVFRQFFSTLPWELDDAARIDGLSGLSIFGRIMLPLSRTALFVVALFSFVWHWNDYLLPGVFLTHGKYPLGVRLSRLWGNIGEVMTVRLQGGAGEVLVSSLHGDPYTVAVLSRNEALGMAASVLVIAVPMVLYFFVQRFFTESVERTGLVE